jgi:hypothetical protein
MKEPLTMQTWRHLGSELKSHLPFTVFATGAGVLLAGVLTYVAILASSPRSPDEHAAATPPAEAAQSAHRHDHDAELAPQVSTASAALFHVFHPLHMLLSAIATTAMFWRHDRRLPRAIATGVVGSIGICGVSDVGMPYLSGLVLGVNMEFHWCVLQHPMLVIPFMVIGVLTGLLAPSAVEHSTQFSHAGHVFVSSMASIMYLISFGMTGWIEQAGYVFIVVVIAVVIPCCLSDIVFPLLVADRKHLASCPDRNHFHRAAPWPPPVENTGHTHAH